MGMVSVFGCRNRYSPGDFSNDSRDLLDFGSLAARKVMVGEYI